MPRQPNGCQVGDVFKRLQASVLLGVIVTIGGGMG